MTGPVRRPAQTVPWKLFWPAVGAATTGTGASLAALFAVPALITIPAVVGVAVAFVVGAHQVVHRSPMFAAARYRYRVQISRLIGVAAFAHAVWVVMFSLRPELWPMWWLLLAGVAVMEYGVAVAHEYVLTRPRLTPATKTGGPPADPRPLSDPEKKFAAGLKGADLGQVTVIGSAPILDEESGRAVGMEFDVRVPAGK